MTVALLMNILSWKGDVKNTTGKKNAMHDLKSQRLSLCGPAVVKIASMLYETVYGHWHSSQGKIFHHDQSQNIK